MELGAALPQERSLFAFAFGEHHQLAAHPLLLGALADRLLQLHQVALAGFDGALGDFGVERECARAFFVGVVEDAQPVESCLLDELLQKIKIRDGFAGKADDEGGAQSDAGNCCADFFQCLEEDLRAAAALHALQNRGRGVLQRQIEILADVVVPGDGVEQFAGDAVGVGVEEAQPAQAFDLGERVEERGEAVLEAEVFAVAGGVLADERDLADAAGDELLGLGDDGFESARAELCRAGWE